MADQLVGFRYLFGIHMGISRGPVDEMVEIKVGDRTAWRGSVKANGEIAIDKPNLFGGEDGEGGVQGALTVMMGQPTQTAPAALASVLSTPMPGFRRMFTVFFNGVMCMMNPYPKPWKFRVRRSLAGWDGDPWYPEKAIISLVRPISAGESMSSSETTNVSDSESDLIAVPSGPNAVVTLSTTETVTSIIDITLFLNFGSGDNETSSELRVSEGGFTRVGNVITITPAAGFDPLVAFSLGYIHSYRVNYTYALTTVDPIGGNLGDTLIQAMNPAHILFETYTNREWGRGLPAASLDEDSWKAAADTLFGERFGMCIRWNRRDSIESFLQGVLDHIGGVIYPDRTTSKIKIKLIRDDYARGDLPLFTASTGLLSVTDASVSAGGSMVNEVRVTYRDPVTNEDRTVRASNLAGVQSAGGMINTISREFRGLPTAELASRVAKRELRALSPSVRRFSIHLDRRGNGVIPGGVIRISDPTRNIPDTVLRVGTVDYGKMGEGTIEVVGIQDVFGLPKRPLGTLGPPTGGGSGASGVSACIGTHLAFEVPYRSVYRSLTKSEFAFIDSDSAFLGTVVDQGQPLNFSYQTAVKSGAPDAGTETPPDGSYNCPI